MRGTGQCVVENGPLHVRRRSREGMMQHDMSVTQDCDDSQVLEVKQDFSPVADAIFGTVAVVMPNASK